MKIKEIINRLERIDKIVPEQIDKLVKFLDSEREKHEGIGLADFHIECITVAYNQGRIDKEKELRPTDKEEVKA